MLAPPIIGLRRSASKSAAEMLPGEDSRWKMELSTSWSLEPRAPSTASKPELVCANTAWDCVFTTHTVSRRPLASAMLPAVTSVESACWRRER